MLKFPGEEVVTLELARRPADGRVEIGTGYSHLPIQVDDLNAMIAALTGAGIRAGPVELPGGPAGPHVSWLTDPDGYRIELVEWPPGHAYGITAADFCASAWRTLERRLRDLDSGAAGAKQLVARQRRRECGSGRLSWAGSSVPAVTNSSSPDPTAATGTSRATGRPWSVTSSFSPALTLR